MRRRHRTLLLLLPFLLSGCGVLETMTGGGSASGGAAGAQPSATPWISVSRGSATPVPVPSRPSGSPTSAAPTGFLPLPSAAPRRPTPAATCAHATYDFARINGLIVRPGTTSASTTWYNIGGYNLVEFRVTAISQDVRLGKQRDIGWVVVRPTAPCGPVSATITGLSRRTHYTVSIDAVVTRRSGDGTHAATVFRSGVVLTG